MQNVSFLFSLRYVKYSLLKNKSDIKSILPGSFNLSKRPLKRMVDVDCLLKTAGKEIYFKMFIAKSRLT